MKPWSCAGHGSTMPPAETAADSSGRFSLHDPLFLITSIAGIAIAANGNTAAMPLAFKAMANKALQLGYKLPKNTPPGQPVEYEGHPGMMANQLKAKDARNILQQAVDDAGVTGLTITLRVTKNPQDDEGITPLELATANGHVEICELINHRNNP